MLKMFYPFACVESVFSIDYKKLYNAGFKAIIFDIDNTLVHHGKASTPEVDALFERLHSLGFKTLLMSNNCQKRIEKFNRNINTLFIPDARKPFVKKYKKAISMLKVKDTEVIFVGDQLFTDVLGANKVGIPSILVQHFRGNSGKGIGKRRKLENFILKFYDSNNKYRNRLGDIEKGGE